MTILNTTSMISDPALINFFPINTMPYIRKWSTAVFAVMSTSIARSDTKHTAKPDKHIKINLDQPLLFWERFTDKFLDIAWADTKLNFVRSTYSRKF